MTGYRSWEKGWEIMGWKIMGWKIMGWKIRGWEIEDEIGGKRSGK